MTELTTAASSVPGATTVLTPEALAFVADLHDRFADRRDLLLAARPERHRRIAAAGRLGATWLEGTASIRADAAWQVAETPPSLRDRRVEITGPTDRKMTINALNSGARVWLADLEDANTPHWTNVVAGQVNLRDAVRRTIEHTVGQRVYRLREDGVAPTIIMRPRGWHLDEKHVAVAGRPAVGALVDFGLYFFHNAAELLERGTGPYFYLPKLESHLEARLWADVFAAAETQLDIPSGSVRATVLIETLPAALEMEEILYELRAYASGLNAGRWDYLFSIIKILRSAGPEFVLPDRNSVTMTAPFMQAYANRLVDVCHRRGAYAIGGMAAFVPTRHDDEVNRTAFAKVRADKRREAGQGFDGSWVAHPGLVSVCESEFETVLGSGDNQLEVRPGVTGGPQEFLTLDMADPAFTEEGLRRNVAVCVEYLTSWLAGVGAVAIANLMEDAATAEIARAQIWQWRHAAITLDTGRVVTAELVEQMIAEEKARLIDATPHSFADDHVHRASTLVRTLVLGDEFPDFLTEPAYALID